ncbi:sigma-70 family RNA polymerase sigma factor, partial [Candidatus Woesearchaeota archaeon]|nr:sigma-70 family RNA polymerase sigma factor [Candidatus Woesearchaeota archaeon]
WDHLRDEFMSANYGLVITIAKRYRRNNGLDFKDLIQEGNVGLIKSIDKFDYSLGYKFSTYASWWIRQSITRSIADNGRTIRLPVYIFDDLRKYLRAETDYLSLHGEIDPEIIAREQNIDPEKIKRNLKASLDPISLNASFGEDQRTELIDLIENENRISPEEEAIQNALKRTISEVLSLQLSEKEQSILHLRYGIGNEQDLTLEEVGDMFNLTRERIRQIQEKALRTLRRKGAEELIQFYEE